MEILVKRLKLSKRLDYIVVATTTDNEDLKIKEVCDKIGIPCFNIGDPEEALITVLKTAESVSSFLGEPINVIDITCDCPFIDPKQLDKTLEIFTSDNYNYLSNCMIRSFPIGFDLQIYNLELLSNVEKLISNKKHRVHSGWNIWTYSALLQQNKMYKFGNIPASEEYFYPNWRVVLDYPEDLILLKNTIKHFNRIDFTCEEVIDYLKSKPELLNVNANCKQKISGLDK